MKKYNIKKFINCILFFAKRTNPKKLGILKLNKLLYYADFKHYKKYGRSITGDVYIKMEHGPVPSFSYNIFNMAFRDKKDDKTSKELRNSIKVRQSNIFGLNIKSIYPRKDFDKLLFSDSELEVLSSIASKWADKTGTAMSRETHQADTPWSRTPEMQPINHKLILDKKSISKDYIEYWETEEKELIDLFA